MQAGLRRRVFYRWIFRVCLALQFALLATFAALDFYDERLEMISFSSMLYGRVDSYLPAYNILLPVLVLALAISLVLFSACLFVADPTQRSVRQLIVLTTVIAFTLGLFTNWKRISWEGRRYRIRGHIESLQTVFDTLQKDWPTNDMNHELLGPIMAYPQWNPSTLILLTPKPIDDRLRIAAIDRSSTNVVRFELSSGYETIWIEHRVETELDSEFTNGIAQKYTRQHYVSISPDWYLVRYQ